MNSELDKAQFRPWHRDLATELTTTYRDQRLHHALLISGPEGLGKAKFAHSLAAVLLCEHSFSGSVSSEKLYCGQCRACSLYAAGTHPDLYLLSSAEKKKNIAIDDVRSLREKLQQKAQISAEKVCLVTTADEFSESSASALLKMLEEPPEATYFILVSHREQKLLPTIKSRCYRLRFSLPIQAVLKRELGQYYQPQAVDSAIALYRGFPEQVLSYLQSGSKVAQESELAVTQSATADEMIDKEIDQLFVGKKTIQTFIEQTAQCDLDYIVIALLRSVHRRLMANEVQLKSSPVAGQTSNRLFFVQQRLLQARGMMVSNPNRVTFLTNLLDDCASIVGNR